MRLLTAPQEDMMYRWMELVNPGIKCCHLHADSTCAYQVYHKVSGSLAKGFKFYLVLHLLPFLIFKAKKINNWKKFREELLHLAKKYIGSLCFMSTLVGSIKVFLCFSEKITKPDPTFEGKVFVWGSLLSSLSIFFEEAHRREEIVFFVFVRAARSAYSWAAKRKYLSLPYEENLAFVVLFALLFYFYDRKLELVKNRNLFQKLWGVI